MGRRQATNGGWARWRDIQRNRNMTTSTNWNQRRACKMASRISVPRCKPIVRTCPSSETGFGRESFSTSRLMRLTDIPRSAPRLHSERTLRAASRINYDNPSTTHHMLDHGSPLEGPGWFVRGGVRLGVPALREAKRRLTANTNGISAGERQRGFQPLRLGSHGTAARNSATARWSKYVAVVTGDAWPRSVATVAVLAPARRHRMAYVCRQLWAEPCLA